MEPEKQYSIRLNRSERLTLAIILGLAVAAFFYLQTHYSRAFPEYNITFKVDQQEAIRIADTFIDQFGGAPEGFKSAVIFDIDQTTKTFLERTQGPDTAGQIMQNAIPVWYWSVRFFQPLNPEEYRLHITPQGAIVAYEHTISEERVLPTLSQRQALQLCRRFLHQVARFEPRNWTLLDERTEKQPQRVDYHFSFQKKNFRIAEAVERLDVTIKGDQIGSFRFYLKLPESWLRDYQHLRSRNSSTALAAQAAMVLLGIALLIQFIQNARRHLLVWKPMLTWGAVTLVLSFITEINSLPLRLFEMEVNQSPANFYGTFFLMALFSSLGLALLVVVIIGASEALNAQMYPRQIAFHALFTPTGLRTKHFLFGTVTGLCLVPIFIAFQTFFYLWARRFGAWAPVEVGYSNVVNTALPWLFVLFGGFAPAILEEGIFRLFAIPFLSRHLRSRLFAVLIPAFVWGFAHANYPNQPFWIRGVEVGFFGILVSLIFLKVNVLPLLIWHYTIDAFYGATLLLKMGNIYYFLSAAVCAGLFFFPLILNLVSYIRRRSFAPEENLIYLKRLPITHHLESTAPFIGLTRPYEKLTRRQCFFLIGSTVVFLLAFANIKVVSSARRYPVDRQAALDRGRQFLRMQKVADSTFHWAIDLAANYDDLTVKYLLEHTDYRRFQTYMQHDWPNSVTWRIRFFQPLKSAEWQIRVNPTTGEVVAFEHIVPEDEPGARLLPSQARARVEKFLRQKGVNLSDFVLEKSEHLGRRQRTDHFYSYLSVPESPFTIGAARLRIEVELKGSEIASFRSTIKLPEEWRLKQTQQSSIQIVWLLLKIAAVVLIIGMGVHYVLRQGRPAFRQFRTFKPVWLIIIFLSFVGLLAEYRSFLWSYQTSWDLNTYHLVWSILVLLQVLAIALLGLSCYWVFVFCQPEIFRRVEPENLSAYHRDAIIGGFCAVSGLLMLGNLLSWFQQKFYPPALADKTYLPEVLASGFPEVAALRAVALATLGFLVGLSIFGFIWRKTPAPFGLKLLWLCLLVALLLLPDDLDWRGFIFTYLGILVVGGWFLVCVRWILKSNYLGYLYAAWGFFTLRQSLILWQTQATVGKRTAILLTSLWLLGIFGNYLRCSFLAKPSLVGQGEHMGQ